MKDNTKKTISFYLQASKKHKGLIILTLLSVVVASVIEFIIPLFYRDFLNTLVSNQSKDVIINHLYFVISWVAFFLVFSWALWRVASFSSVAFQTKIVSGLYNLCFSYLHHHSFSYFSNSFIGSLVKRVNWFCKAYIDITDRVVWDLSSAFVSFATILIILFWTNIWLGTGVLAWMILFFTVNWFFVKYKLRFDIKRNELETHLTGQLADTLTNHANVKLFNGHEREATDFSRINDEARKATIFSWNFGNTFEAIQAFMMVILEIGMFLLAINLWRQGLFTVGDFYLIQAYLLSIFNRVFSFSRIIRAVYERLADAEEMTEILSTPHEIKDTNKAKNLTVKKGGIKFIDVNFNYHTKTRVLENYNLDIAPGERLAIIGPSGSGKTTIIKLLFRMHDLSGGKILIDGQDISKVTQESLWQNISLVPQDPILFHRSLKENIRYGRFNASDEEVIMAAKLARCHDFISKTENGYDTLVGERGIKLSGGERQRVAIARAILKNAPILVLDEATSSLDSESEKLIQDALNELMKGKTVVVIAHRLSTIRKMDRIIVVNKGEIYEEGTHEWLLKRDDGIYKKLWGMQAGGFIV